MTEHKTLRGDRADDAEIARIVTKRDVSDTGERITLDDLLTENGLTRKEIDCPCPGPFRDAAYCDDCPYREELPPDGCSLSGDNCRRLS